MALTAAQARTVASIAGTVPDGYDADAALDDYGDIIAVCLDLVRFKLAALRDQPAEFTAQADGSYRTAENIRALTVEADRLADILRARAADLNDAALDLVGNLTPIADIPSLVTLAPGIPARPDGR